MTDAWNATERWKPFYEQYYEDRLHGNYTQSAAIALELFKPKIVSIVNKFNFENSKRGIQAEFEDIYHDAYIFLLLKIIPDYDITKNDNFVAYAEPRFKSLMNITIDGDEIHFTNNRANGPMIISLDDERDNIEGNKEQTYNKISTNNGFDICDDERELQHEFFKTCLSAFNQRYGQKHGTFTYCKFYFTKAYRWGWSILETYEKVFRYFEVLGAPPLNDNYTDGFLKDKKELCLDRLCRNLGLDKEFLIRYEQMGRKQHPEFKDSLILLYLANTEIETFEKFKPVKDIYFVMS